MTDVKSEGGGGGKVGGGGRRNNFRSKNNTYASNTKSHKSEMYELETAMYIVSQVSLADWYEKVTKAIYRYVIRKLPAGLELPRVIRDGMLPSFLLPTKSKKEPGVYAGEWKIATKNNLEKRHYGE